MSTKKLLMFVVNAGFAEEIIDISRKQGARGATILNARGGGAIHKSIMGITIDSEKELVLSVVDEELVSPIMYAVTAEAGIGSPAHSICFVLPVENMTGTVANMVPPQLDEEKLEGVEQLKGEERRVSLERRQGLERRQRTERRQSPERRHGGDRRHK